MKKLILFNFTVCFLSSTVNAQTPFQSDGLIKYDFSTLKTDKPIPFDKPFTLTVDKLSPKGVYEVHLYEAKIKGGKRELVKDTGNTAIIDSEIKFHPTAEPLQLYLPPIKPKKDFDINIISYLSIENKLKLHKINALINSKKEKEAERAFYKFTSELTDPLINRTYFGYQEFGQYKAFYDSLLIQPYVYLTTTTNFSNNIVISLKDAQIIDTLSSLEKNDFKDINFLVEAIQKNWIDELQTGELDIYTVYQSKAITDLANAYVRIQNLESNIKYFDSLQRRINRIISRGLETSKVDGVSTNVTAIWKNISELRIVLSGNLKLITDKFDEINSSMDKNKYLKQAVYLAGNTVSSDLKTSGASLLFIDAGLANLIVPDLNDKPFYIPKLYWGVSVYFRPIDKNTRRQTFPLKKKLKANALNGPDYNCVSHWDIRQHLCLNVGITLGSMNNKDYDNFYNTSSLLVGPAIRFCRAFKFSAGASFVKRSSKNPMISEKKPIIGGYASLSVDIDFIQSIKDVTSILFK